jgi:hypothetical protein
MTELNLKTKLVDRPPLLRRSTRAAHPRAGRVETKVSYSSDVKKALNAKGYHFNTAEDFYISPPLRAALGAFLSECSDLPADKYSEEGTRKRRHTRLILLPWQQQLLCWPKNSYFQEATVNHDAAGIAREFEPLTNSMLENEFLREMILTDFHQLPFAAADLQQPFDVGIHVIKTVPRQNQPAVASPNRLHKDTEPFTFIHLLERENIVGGENIITDNSKEPMFIATLANLMDTIVVKDDAVYHHVMPINLADPQAAGFRTVLLIDFTPMRSAINQYE